MTTDAQMPALLPCPFCGSGPAVSIQNASFSGVEPLYWHGLHFVNCGTCGVEGAKDKDRAAAIAAWNRRADLCASGQVRALDDHRSFPEAADGRPLPPMADDLMTAGLNGEDARFVAIQLAQNGLSLTPAPQPAGEAVPLPVGWSSEMDAHPPQPAGEAVSIQEFVREVWGLCEVAEDEAYEKLSSGAALADHEMGFWRGQKNTAKRIRRAVEMPAHPPQPSVSVAKAAGVLMDSVQREGGTGQVYQAFDDAGCEWDDVFAALRALKGGDA